MKNQLYYPPTEDAAVDDDNRNPSVEPRTIDPSERHNCHNSSVPIYERDKKTTWRHAFTLLANIALRACVNRRITLCACWLGSVFYFVSLTQHAIENMILQNTTHTHTSQWWLNQTIDPNCSCETPWGSFIAPTDRMECCHRSVVGAHKMGWQLLIGINRNYFARIPGGKVRHSELYSVRHITVDEQNSGRKEDYDLLTNLTYQLERDYRTVFVTRNWYDTIISGYLYHQSGRECWLSSGGKGGFSGWLNNFNWKEYLEKERGRTTPYWPQLSAPNLCKYLQLAAPADGLRVYADFAIGYWLHSVSALAEARNSIPPAKSRTLFLCYDQFNENAKIPDAIKEAGNFLYPVDDNTQWDGMKTENHGGGGHSTTTNNTLRMGLHDMLRIIDSVHFDGDIGAGNSKFGCLSEADGSLLTEANRN